jgi:hypothetical protein
VFCAKNKKQFRIPKKVDALAPLVLPEAVVLPQRAPASPADTGPTLRSWGRDLFGGSGRGVEWRVVRVCGLPAELAHAQWEAALHGALHGHGVRAAALSGWRLPCSSEAGHASPAPSYVWRGLGVGYVLVRADRAHAAAAALSACSLRCPGDGALRPLLAELCDAATLRACADAPPTLHGHLHHGAPGAAQQQAHHAAAARGETIVPHFVQANTLELDMSLEWRTLIRAHLIASARLQQQQAAELGKMLRPGATRA